MIDARLHPADVIAHNEENIGLLLLLLLLLLLHLLRLRSLLLLRGHRHAHHHHRGSDGCEPHGFGNAHTPFPLNRLPELGRQPAPESTARILSPASGGLNCTKGKVGPYVSVGVQQHRRHGPCCGRIDAHGPPPTPPPS